jgi:phasin
MEAPQAFREMANKATAQAGESYERMGAATAEASNVIQNACSTATRGAMNCNAKVIEFAHANSKAAFDYASELLGVKSPSEFLQVSTEQARKQFEVLSGQAKELTALSQQVMLEAAEPFRAGAAKAFRGPLA